jgi:cell division protein FtsZ
VDGAAGALVNVSGGADVTIKECQQIVEAVSSKLSQDAKIIWGAQINKDMGDTVRAMLVVTGVKSNQVYAGGPALSKQKEKEIEKILGIDFI